MVRFRIHLEQKPLKPRIIPGSIRILAFNITDKCNLKCPHCFAEDSRVEMSTDECKEVLKQAKEHNCVRVIMCGKEPLLREDIFEILNYIKELGMDVELMTNGTLTNEGALEKLKNAGVSKVQISLDGFRKTHDELRGLEGTYDLAFQSMKLLLESGFEAAVNSVVLKKNIKELPELFDMMLKEFPEMKEWRLSRLIPTRLKNPDFRYFDTYIQSISNIIKYLSNLERHYYIEIEDNPIVFDSIIPEHMKDLVIYTPCGVITHTIDVLNNGDVVFCVPMGSHPEPVIHGNILTDGLDKIISSVRKYQNNDVDDDICRSCEYYPKKCLGGCRCVAYAYRQNEYSADPFCPKIRESLGKEESERGLE